MILRTYGCGDCGNMMEVELRADQWDQEPPDCPVCAMQTHQQFKPPAIGGSNRARAADLALKIASEDYGVADIQPQGPNGGPPKVRYKDMTPGVLPSNWTMPSPALAEATALGRESRLRHGSGLDVLQSTLKDGTLPDLIELSKRRSARIW